MWAAIKKTRALGLFSILALAGANAQMGSGGGQDAPPMAGMGRMVRGTITATAPDKFTVKTEAGEIYQVSISPNTRVMKGRDPMKATDIHVGDGVGAMGEIDQPNKTVHALALFVVDAEQIKKARENMGKTYIAGKITAIDEVKLTILRTDGVTQTITVDEGTSMKKGGRGMQQMVSGGIMAVPTGQPAAAATGGESITLADIKVGDSVAGQGALKGGVFIPTTLMVGEPGQGGSGGRRRRPDGNTPPPPTTEPK